MLRHLSPLAALALLCACGPDLDAIDPGDRGAIGWQPPARVEGPVIDCHGATRGRLDVRESGTVVRHCTILGDVRVWGPARNGNDDELRERSRTADYVSWLRGEAPSWVTIEDSTIVGSRTVPLFVGPGATMTTVRRVTVTGGSLSTMVYLGAESHGTTLEDVTVDASGASREAIAIDASDGNTLSGVRISHAGHGGIYLYRNCGEYGTSRHTTPSDNRIEAEVRGAPVAVWLGSREGRRDYCGDDRDSQYGSGVSDYDHARRNVVRVETGGVVLQGVTASGNDVERTRD